MGEALAGVPQVYEGSVRENTEDGRGGRAGRARVSQVPRRISRCSKTTQDYARDLMMPCNRPPTEPVERARAAVARGQPCASPR